MRNEKDRRNLKLNKARGGSDRRCLIVAGMHRSGTSALTRVINLLGASINYEVPDAGFDNEKGFWEPREVIEIHDLFFSAIGTSYDSYVEISDNQMSTEAARYAIDQIADFVNSAFDPHHRLLVFKDPRICRVIPLWTAALDRLAVEPAFILPLRHPLEVARSLQRRNGFHLHKGYLMWLRHVLDAERASRGLRRSFVSYDNLMTDWRRVIDRISKDLDLSWPKKTATVSDEIEGFLDASLRHHAISTNGESIDINWVKDCFEQLQYIVNNEEYDLTQLDKISSDMKQSEDIFSSMILSSEDIIKEKNNILDIRDKELSHVRHSEKVLESRLYEREQKLDLVSQALAERDRETARLQELQNDLMERLSQARNDMECYGASVAVKEEALRHAEEGLEQCRYELTLITAELSERDRTIAEQQAETANVEAAASAAEQALHDAQEKLAHRDMELAAATGRISELDRQAVERDAYIVNLNLAVSAIEQALRDAQERLAHGDMALAAATAQVAERDDDISNLNIIISATEGALRATEAKIEQCDRDLMSATAQIDERNRLITEREIAYQDAADRLSRAQTSIEEMRSIAEQREHNLSIALAELYDQQKIIEEQKIDQVKAAERLSQAHADIYDLNAVEAINEGIARRFMAQLHISQSSDVVADRRQHMASIMLQCSKEIALIQYSNIDLQSRLDESEIRISGIASIAKYSHSVSLKAEQSDSTLKNKGGVMKFLFSNFTKRENSEADIIKNDVEAIGRYEEFDNEYYMDRYPDVRAEGVDPLFHYCSIGWKEGRNPCIGFDTLFYLGDSPDVAQSGMNPFVHWLRHGREEGRRASFPKPAELVTREESSSITIVEEFGPEHKDILQSGLFDADYYVVNNPDVADSKLDPIQHFLTYGLKEGRSPSADFDTAFYIAHNPDIAASHEQPFLHWLHYGRAEGRKAAPDRAIDIAEPEETFLLSAKDEYESEYEAVAESGLFDEAYYLLHNPDVAEAGFDPILHYVAFGWKEGRNPSADFETTFYLNQYPDVVASGMNPFVHWSMHGRAENRRGAPEPVTQIVSAPPPIEPRWDASRCFNPSMIFVSHEASRTGAPMVLLSMLRWIKANTDIEFGIVVGADGPLREAFEAVAPCFFMDDYPHEARRDLLREFCGINVQIVYLNTIVSGIYGAYLSFLNAKFITHVHEMENVFQMFEEPFQILQTFCKDYIAVSQGSLEALERRRGDREQNITRIAPFIDRYVPHGAAHSRKPDVPVIYGCGTVETRKGPDLFCDVAEILISRGITEFRMKWIGPKADWDMAGEISRRGIGSHVEWLGSHPNPRDLLKEGSIFILPSREDAFPLVCIEAAEQGLPVICFDHQAGSMHSFVEQDAGIVVKYLDVEEMADSVAELLKDPKKRQQLGDRAKEKMERLHLAEAVCPQIVSLFPPLFSSTASDEFTAYREQLDRAEIVSFDIFDTLITRRLSNPATVFDIIEHRHSAVQSAAIGLFPERMRVAGAVLAKQNGLRDDVNIDEIYEDMPFFRNSKIEKSVELDAVVAHPLGIKLYNYARETGKRVIIVSDMYLDEATICGMLNRCGIENWDKLFLSSTLGYKKDTGRLFPQVVDYARKLGVEAEQIVHLGDNWEGDVHKAKAAGLKALRFIPLYDKRSRKFPLTPAQTQKLSQIGRIWNDFTTQATKLWKERNKGAADDFYMSLGFELTGPLASMMAMYVRTQADKIGAKKIIFMARDGRIIKKAFDTLYAKEISFGNYDVSYAHLSRAVVIPATLQNPLSNSDLYFLIEGLHLGQKSIRYFLEKAGLSATNKKVLKIVQARFDGVDFVPTWSDLLPMTLMMGDLSGEIFKANAPAREKFAAYLRQFGIDRGEKVIMVDVGWLLNIQSRFHQFCRDLKIPEDVVGIYVGSRDRVDKSLPHSSLLFDGGDPRHYADMIEENTTLFEVLFSAPEPSASGLEWGDNRAVEVALKPLPMPRSKEFEIARKLHFGAEAFFDELASSLGHFLPERISRDFFFSAFEALIHSSDPDAHREFGSFEVLLGGHHEFVAHQSLLKGRPHAAPPIRTRGEYFDPVTLGRGADNGKAVAIVTSAGLDNGSTRYRAAHLGESLDAIGIGATLFHSETGADQFEAELRRFDTVVFQRCFTDQGNVRAILASARRAGKRCVMEIDDLVFPDFLPVIGSVVGGEWNYDEALYVSSAYEAMMKDMDGAIVSTEEIGSFVGKNFNVPTAIYRNRVRGLGISTADPTKPLRLIYASGTYSHKEDYTLIAQSMRELLKTHPEVSLSLLGATQVPDQLLSMANVSAYPLLPYDMMLSFIASHHLMIVPLTDSIFNHAKSHVKYLECASVGVPVLASEVKEYSIAIKDGDNGFLVKTQEEWRERLFDVARDRSQLSKIGKNARDAVARDGLCSTVDRKTAEMLKSVLFGK